MKKKEEHRYISMVVPYVLGELSPRRRESFGQHFRTGCHLCMMELAETEEAFHGLPLVLLNAAPPPGLKQRLLASAAARAHSVKETTVRSPQRWFGYVSYFLILAIVVGFWIYSEDLITTVDSQVVEITRLREELRQKEELLAVLQGPRIEIITMKGLTPSPGGYGKIIWDPAKKVAIFQVSNLPNIPADKDYQLWIIRKRKAIPAGVFAVREEKERESVFKLIGIDVASRNEIDAFAVTLEPKGGVAQPSGQMYLLGNTR